MSEQREHLSSNKERTNDSCPFPPPWADKKRATEITKAERASMFERASWKVALSAGPPRNASAADELSRMLMEWAPQQLRRWFPTHRRQDLEEIDSLFTYSLARTGFVCLARVEPTRREAYLRCTLKHEAYRFFARLKRQEARETLCLDVTVHDEDGGEHTLDLDDLPGRAQDPEEAVMQRVGYHEIVAAAAAMDEANQRIFEHYFLRGNQEKEVAGLLGLPVGTISRHIHEIRAKLRSSLGGGPSPIGDGLPGVVRGPRRGERDRQSMPRASRHEDKSCGTSCRDGEGFAGSDDSH